jgi:hypothetical protein
MVAVDSTKAAMTMTDIVDEKASWRLIIRPFVMLTLFTIGVAMAWCNAALAANRLIFADRLGGLAPGRWQRLFSAG